MAAFDTLVVLELDVDVVDDSTELNTVLGTSSLIFSDFLLVSFILLSEIFVLLTFSAKVDSVIPVGLNDEAFNDCASALLTIVFSSETLQILSIFQERFFFISLILLFLVLINPSNSFASAFNASTSSYSSSSSFFVLLLLLLLLLIPFKRAFIIFNLLLFSSLFLSISLISWSSFSSLSTLIITIIIIIIINN